MNTGNENKDSDADGFGAMAMVVHRSAEGKPRKRRRTISVPKHPETTASSSACTECGKEFFSKKALFGHMRCHPERDWRGINPPRRRLSPAISSSPAAGDSVEYEIAACLLLLAAGGVGREVFECSSCKKVFRSHQALGGHRASHKNVKGCFAMAARPSSSSALGLDLNLPPAVEVEAEPEPDECCLSSLSSSCDFLDLRLAL